MVGTRRAPAARKTPERRPTEVAALGENKAGFSGEIRIDDGGRGLGRRRVTHIQRVRLLAAMSEEACKRGAANVTVAHVVERAGVSRRTFYEQFEDREDCFLAAFDDAIVQARERVLDAWEPETSWTVRMRAALGAFLLFIDEAPFAARVLVVESLSGGPEVLRRRQVVIAQAIEAIDEGRGRTGSGSAPSPLAAEGVVGGVLGVLHARLCEPEHAPASELLGALMAMIVQPFLGTAAAQRELARPSPKPANGSHPSTGRSPLNGLHMRLTYRTICVLAALAANPGSSNRKLAEASGVADQGQMSKLLNRLNKEGFVQNMSTGGPSRGEPNAWTLTNQGWQIHSALPRQPAN